MQNKKTQNKETLSDVIVGYLEQFGIEYVFGIPGGHTTPIYEALARSEKRGGPRAVLTRHESGAAFMAAGYARETGKVGVCCATTGPGITNIITGVAAAHADHLPLLVITGQTLMLFSGLGALQESAPYETFPDNIDALGLMKHCTKYNTLISHPDQLEKKIASSLITALRPLRGPAHVSITPDILRTSIPEDRPISYPDLHRLLNCPSSFIDTPVIEQLWEEVYNILKKDRKIVLHIGHECAGATQEIITFAELTGSLIVTSLRGKSWINPYHPLARGIFGVFGHKSARRALTDESVELILSVGTSLGQWATGAWDQALLNQKLVHIHHSNTYFLRSPMACLHVCGTIKTIFHELNKRIDKIRPRHTIALQKGTFPPPQIEVQAPARYRDASSPLKPQYLVRKLIEHFPTETRFIIDNGNCLVWAFHYFFTQYPDNFRTLMGQPSTGCSPGFAVGTAMGASNTPVVCLIGDGSFLMYGMDIAVAVAEKLPIIFVILNDRSFGMIKHRHRQTKDKHTGLDFAFPPTNFSLMAESVGAKGYIIRKAEDLELNYHKIYTHQGPTVLDVYIDTEEPPPLGIF